MFPFSLFKKKKIEPEEDYSQQSQPNFSQFPQQNFREPFQSQNNSLQGLDSGNMKDDLILSRLETLNAKMDNIIQRLERIERLAKE